MSDRTDKTRITVPLGFRELLGALCREILRHQPKNIIEFSALYFEQKLRERDGGSRPILKRLGNRDVIRQALDSGIITTEVEDMAALKIQSVYRGHQARCEVKQLRAERGLAASNVPGAVCENIQGGLRFHRNHRRLFLTEEANRRRNSHPVPDPVIKAVKASLGNFTEDSNLSAKGLLPSTIAEERMQSQLSSDSGSSSSINTTIDILSTTPPRISPRSCLRSPTTTGVQALRRGFRTTRSTSANAAQRRHRRKKVCHGDTDGGVGDWGVEHGRPLSPMRIYLLDEQHRLQPLDVIRQCTDGMVLSVLRPPTDFIVAPVFPNYTTQSPHSQPTPSAAVLAAQQQDIPTQPSQTSLTLVSSSHAQPIPTDTHISEYISNKLKPGAAESFHRRSVASVRGSRSVLRLGSESSDEGFAHAEGTPGPPPNTPVPSLSDHSSKTKLEVASSESTLPRSQTSLMMPPPPPNTPVTSLSDASHQQPDRLVRAFKDIDAEPHKTKKYSYPDVGGFPRRHPDNDDTGIGSGPQVQGSLTMPDQKQRRGSLQQQEARRSFHREFGQPQAAFQSTRQQTSAKGPSQKGQCAKCSQKAAKERAPNVPSKVDISMDEAQQMSSWLQTQLQTSVLRKQKLSSDLALQICSWLQDQLCGLASVKQLQHQMTTASADRQQQQRLQSTEQLSGEKVEQVSEWLQQQLQLSAEWIDSSTECRHSIESQQLSLSNEEVKQVGQWLQGQMRLSAEYVDKTGQWPPPKMQLSAEGLKRQTRPLQQYQTQSSEQVEQVGQWPKPPAKQRTANEQSWEWQQQQTKPRKESTYRVVHAAPSDQTQHPFTFSPEQVELVGDWLQNQLQLSTEEVDQVFVQLSVDQIEQVGQWLQQHLGSSTEVAGVAQQSRSREQPAETFPPSASTVEQVSQWLRQQLQLSADKGTKVSHLPKQELQLSAEQVEQVGQWLHGQKTQPSVSTALHTEPIVQQLQQSEQLGPTQQAEPEQAALERLEKWPHLVKDLLPTKMQQVAQYIQNQLYLSKEKIEPSPSAEQWLNQEQPCSCKQSVFTENRWSLEEQSCSCRQKPLNESVHSQQKQAEQAGWPQMHPPPDEVDERLEKWPQFEKDVLPIKMQKVAQYIQQKLHLSAEKIEQRAAEDQWQREEHPCSCQQQVFPANRWSAEEQPCVCQRKRPLGTCEAPGELNLSLEKIAQIDQWLQEQIKSTERAQPPGQWLKPHKLPMSTERVLSEDHLQLSAEDVEILGQWIEQQLRISSERVEIEPTDGVGVYSQQQLHLSSVELDQVGQWIQYQLRLSVEGFERMTVEPTQLSSEQTESRDFRKGTVYKPELNLSAESAEAAGKPLQEQTRLAAEKSMNMTRLSGEQVRSRPGEHFQWERETPQDSGRPEQMWTNERMQHMDQLPRSQWSAGKVSSGAEQQQQRVSEDGMSQSLGEANVEQARLWFENPLEQKPLPEKMIPETQWPSQTLPSTGKSNDHVGKWPQQGELQLSNAGMSQVIQRPQQFLGEEIKPPGTWPPSKKESEQFKLHQEKEDSVSSTWPQKLSDVQKMSFLQQPEQEVFGDSTLPAGTLLQQVELNQRTQKVPLLTQTFSNESLKQVGNQQQERRFSGDRKPDKQRSRQDSEATGSWFQQENVSGENVKHITDWPQQQQSSKIESSNIRSQLPSERAKQVEHWQQKQQRSGDRIEAVGPWSQHQKLSDERVIQVGPSAEQINISMEWPQQQKLPAEKIKQTTLSSSEQARVAGLRPLQQDISAEKRKQVGQWPQQPISSEQTEVADAWPKQPASREQEKQNEQWHQQQVPDEQAVSMGPWQQQQQYLLPGDRIKQADQWPQEQVETVGTWSHQQQLSPDEVEQVRQRTQQEFPSTEVETVESWSKQQRLPAEGMQQLLSEQQVFTGQAVGEWQQEQFSGQKIKQGVQRQQQDRQELWKQQQQHYPDERVKQAGQWSQKLGEEVEPQGMWRQQQQPPDERVKQTGQWQQQNLPDEQLDSAGIWSQQQHQAEQWSQQQMSRERVKPVGPHFPQGLTGEPQSQYGQMQVPEESTSFFGGFPQQIQQKRQGLDQEQFPQQVYLSGESVIPMSTWAQQEQRLAKEAITDSGAKPLQQEHFTGARIKNPEQWPQTQVSDGTIEQSAKWQHTLSGEQTEPAPLSRDDIEEITKWPQQPLKLSVEQIEQVGQWIQQQLQLSCDTTSVAGMEQSAAAGKRAAEQVSQLSTEVLKLSSDKIDQVGQFLKHQLNLSAENVDLFLTLPQGSIENIEDTGLWQEMKKKSLIEQSESHEIASQRSEQKGLVSTEEIELVKQFLQEKLTEEKEVERYSVGSTGQLELSLDELDQVGEWLQVQLQLLAKKVELLRQWAEDQYKSSLPSPQSSKFSTRFQPSAPSNQWGESAAKSSSYHQVEESMASSQWSQRRQGRWSLNVDPNSQAGGLNLQQTALQPEESRSFEADVEEVTHVSRPLMQRSPYDRVDRWEQQRQQRSRQQQQQLQPSHDYDYYLQRPSLQADDDIWLQIRQQQVQGSDRAIIADPWQRQHTQTVQEDNEDDDAIFEDALQDIYEPTDAQNQQTVGRIQANITQYEPTADVQLQRHELRQLQRQAELMHLELQRRQMQDSQQLQEETKRYQRMKELQKLNALERLTAQQLNLQSQQIPERRVVLVDQETQATVEQRDEIRSLLRRGWRLMTFHQRIQRGIRDATGQDLLLPLSQINVPSWLSRVSRTMMDTVDLIGRSGSMLIQEGVNSEQVNERIRDLATYVTEIIDDLLYERLAIPILHTPRSIGSPGSSVVSYATARSPSEVSPRTRPIGLLRSSVPTRPGRLPAASVGNEQSSSSLTHANNPIVVNANSTQPAGGGRASESEANSAATPSEEPDIVTRTSSKSSWRQIEPTDKNFATYFVTTPHKVPYSVNRSAAQDVPIPVVPSRIGATANESNTSGFINAVHRVKSPSPLPTTRLSELTTPIRNPISYSNSTASASPISLNSASSSSTPLRPTPSFKPITRTPSIPLPPPPTVDNLPTSNDFSFSQGTAESPTPNPSPLPFQFLDKSPWDRNGGG